jgi:hypothetical protein
MQSYISTSLIRLPNSPGCSLILWAHVRIIMVEVVRAGCSEGAKREQITQRGIVRKTSRGGRVTRSSAMA